MSFNVTITAATLRPKVDPYFPLDFLGPVVWKWVSFNPGLNWCLTDDWVYLLNPIRPGLFEAAWAGGGGGGGVGWAESARGL